jgi:DNA-3-methyladenine glycosylase
MGMLPKSFYQRDAETVARELIGKVLVRRVTTRKLQARIVETEAYVGAHDLACHAARGRTARTEVMFGPGGHAYIYFIYGMYYMLNFVTGLEGDAQAVLIRAGEPLDGWDADLSGPGKLARAMHLTRAQNGLTLTSPELHVTTGEGRPTIATSPRIGVDYAGEWKHKHLRFFDANSKSVSRRK